MTFQSLKYALWPVLEPLLHLYRRLAHGTTTGVRAMVIDGNNQVFLVKHSYVAGWHLPGGGVDVGETVRVAMARELFEETNIKVAGEPTLVGLFFNNRVSRRDHVALFIVRDFIQEMPPEPNQEIIAHGFFAVDALPADTTTATRTRISEVFEGGRPSELW